MNDFPNRKLPEWLIDTTAKSSTPSGAKRRRRSDANANDAVLAKAQQQQRKRATTRPVKSEKVDIDSNIANSKARDRGDPDADAEYRRSVARMRSLLASATQKGDEGSKKGELARGDNVLLGLFGDSGGEARRACASGKSATKPAKDDRCSVAEHQNQKSAKQNFAVTQDTRIATDLSSEDEDAMVRALVGERLAPLDGSVSKMSPTTQHAKKQRANDTTALVIPKTGTSTKLRGKLIVKRRSAASVARKYAERDPDEFSSASDSEEKCLLRKTSKHPPVLHTNKTKTNKQTNIVLTFEFIVDFLSKSLICISIRQI